VMWLVALQDRSSVQASLLEKLPWAEREFRQDPAQLGNFVNIWTRWSCDADSIMATSSPGRMRPRWFLHGLKLPESSISTTTRPCCPERLYYSAWWASRLTPRDASAKEQLSACMSREGILFFIYSTWLSLGRFLYACIHASTDSSCIPMYTWLTWLVLMHLFFVRGCATTKPPRVFTLADLLLWLDQPLRRNFFVRRTLRGSTHISPIDLSGGIEEYQSNQHPDLDILLPTSLISIRGARVITTML
jgi:hypothetical protein